MQNINPPGTVGYQAVALHFTQSQATVPEKKKCQVTKLPSLAPFVIQTSNEFSSFAFYNTKNSAYNKSRRVKLKLQFGNEREGLESRLGNQIQANNFKN